MRAIPLSLLPVLMAASVPDAAIADTRREPIHPEREQMSPMLRHDQVLADLKAVLTGPASATTIATKPFLYSQSGLCQRDVIRLRYNSERDSERSWRGPVGIGSFEPVGIAGSYSEYHFLGSTMAPPGGWKKACADLADKDVYWARSEDASGAASALSALERAIVDARQSTGVTFDCGRLGFEDEARCRSEFLAAASHISSANGCPAPAGRNMIRCYTYILDENEVKIVTDISTHGVRSTAIEMKGAPIEI